MAVEFKDRRIERENTYTMLQNKDGTVTLIPVTGQVYESGTALNAQNLNANFKEINSTLADIPKQSYITEKAKQVDLNTTNNKVANLELDKASKTEVNNKVWSMANMGQDVKEALTGGSVAVVGKDIVSDINVLESGIAGYNLKGALDKNIYSKLMKGYKVSGSLITNITPSEEFSTTKMFRIEPNTKIFYENIPSAIFYYYDETGTKISESTWIAQGTSGEVTIPNTPTISKCIAMFNTSTLKDNCVINVKTKEVINKTILKNYKVQNSSLLDIGKQSFCRKEIVDIKTTMDVNFYQRYNIVSGTGYKNIEVDCINLNSVSVYCKTYAQYVNAVTLFKSDKIIGFIDYKSEGGYIDIDTTDCDKVIVCVGKNTEVHIYKIFYDENNLSGKKIAWFGTSIPAGGLRGNGNMLSYPMQVGNLLGATVYNEAFGSSCVSAKYPSLISSSNPYGFCDDFERASRCLTNTIEEMNWIIDNKDSGVFTKRVPQTLQEYEKWNIRDCSYENKLNRYLSGLITPNGGNIGDVDMYIFDHGYNDDMDVNYENLIQQYGENNKYSFRGAMNFLIDYIKEHNPRARIVMIGRYENQVKPSETIKQQDIASDWSIPLMRRWEYLGWSQKKITINGEQKTLLNYWLPDGIHPHSDLTGESTGLNAYCISNWLRTI